jgi:hypothetical protein
MIVIICKALITICLDFLKKYPTASLSFYRQNKLSHRLDSKFHVHVHDMSMYIQCMTHTRLQLSFEVMIMSDSNKRTELFMISYIIHH